MHLEKEFLMIIEPEFSGEYNKQIDLSNYPKGVYVVQIYTETSYVSKRLVVQ